MSRWLETDIALFYWINKGWANPFLDGFMPLMSGKSLLPVGFIVVACMAWRMGRRGIAAIACLALIIGLGEGLILSPLKDFFARPRPPYTLHDIRLLLGRSGSGSMPSAHAANWFCATAILGLFWRPTLCLTLPLAVIVSLSRVYNGVHYPSDITAGAILGATYGTLGVLTINAAWKQWMPRLNPRIHQWLPSLLPTKPSLPPAADSSD
jgi:undecaprenyl-diphosphatase